MATFLAGLPPGARAGSISTNKLAQCNVTWWSPSSDSFGAIPLGNGDLALNLWAQTNGSLYVYVAKSDSVDENGLLLKLGRVRVTFSPNPFATGQPFQQALQLLNGEVVLSGGATGSQVRVTAWADANHPAAYLDVTSDQPVGITVALEAWRTNQMTLTGTNLAYEWTGNTNPMYSDADTFLNESNDLVWYHRNVRTTWPEDLQLLNLGSLITNYADPLLNRTMGALIQGTGLRQMDAKTLQTAAPVTNSTIALYVLTAQTATATDWRSNLDTVVAQSSVPTHADALSAHQAWWQAFWNRSWIFVSNNAAISPLVTNTLTVRFGADSTGASKFSGAMSDVAIFTQPLTQGQISQLAQGATTPAALGALGWWPLTNASAGISPNVTGTEGGATVEGNVTFAAVGGRNAAQFGGGYLQVPNSTALGLNAGGTLCAWVRPSALGSGGARLIDKCPVGTSNGYTFDTYPSNSLRLITSADTLNWAANLSTSSWTHVAATFDPARRTDALFINGIPVTNSVLSQEAQVNQGYALQRYMDACAGRGALPIKFNGSLFTVDTQAGGTYPGLNATDIGRNADYRRWGSCYWLQNTRLPYWSMLATGDYEMAQPLFNLLSSAMPLARDRVLTWYGQTGAVFPETMFFWGNQNLNNYGWPSARSGYAPGVSVNSYIRYHFNGTLEITLMMLDWYSHTQDQVTLQNTILPMARDFLTFWSQYYATNAQGQLVLYPDQALETYQSPCTNPVPDIAGLQKVCTELLALPASQTTPSDQAQWQSLLNAVPPLPFGTNAGSRVILPAQAYGSPANTENPQLYPVFPYRLYMLQKTNLSVAQTTFADRLNKNVGGWSQDPIDAACLGYASQAQADVISIFSTFNSRARFPAMWGPIHDYIPEIDHGAVAMLALQSMLVQADGQTILLQPSWPTNWDADFKLHTLQQTTVEGTVQSGQLQTCVVTPMARLGDVLVGPTLAPSRLTYQQWLSYYPALGAAAPHADFDLDGACNLLEYAGGTDPTDPQSKPKLSTALNPAQSQITIGYQRNWLASDLTWSLQQSGDLKNWYPIADTTGGTNGAIELRTAAVPISSTPQFFRLTVDLLAP